MAKADTLPLERQTYNLAEVAVLLGVSERYVYTLARENRLPGVVRCGSRWLMPRARLRALLGDVEPLAAADG